MNGFSLPIADLDGVVRAAVGLLRQQRPELAEPPIELIDRGFSSFVLTTGSGCILRVARTPEAGVGHARERGLLTALAHRLPVPVPNPVWWQPGGGACRYGAMAYRRIEGSVLARTPQPDAVVEQLTDFLVHLHGLDHQAVGGAVTSATEWRTAVSLSLEVSLDRLSHDLADEELRGLQVWREEFLRHLHELRPSDCAVLHGDFWHDNILVRGDRLVGVLDWEAARLGDPAADLAPVWDIDVDLGARLLAAYLRRRSFDASLPERVRLFRVARSVNGVAWCVRNNDQEEYVDALAKVRSVLPLL